MKFELIKKVPIARPRGHDARMPREPAPLHEAGGLCVLSNGALPFRSSLGMTLTFPKISSSIFDTTRMM